MGDGGAGWVGGREKIEFGVNTDGGNAGAEDEEDSTGERGKRCVCLSSKLFLLAGIVFGKRCVCVRRR